MAEWLYGVTLGGDAPAVPGVDDHPVRVVREGELSALVSSVPLSRFDADVLRRELEDLDRVEALARAHDRVVEAAPDVLPARLCTLYESPEAVAGMLRAEHEGLRSALERLAGKVELGVKAYARPEEQRARASSGADYLARKGAKREASASLDATLEAIHARLSEAAEGSVVNHPRDSLFNGAYLVADQERFAALVASLADEHGVDLQLTGPWAPYHFVA